MISAQALDTMNKLKEINEYVRLTLDRLPGIHADLVRIGEEWQEWTFPQVADALRKWTTRNPRIILSPESSFTRENTYQTNNKNYKHRHREKYEHKASDCKTVSDIEERRLLLSKKKIMFHLYRN